MRILFLINSFGSRSETFISDQLTYYNHHAEVKVWCKFGADQSNITSFHFPVFSQRWKFIIKNARYFTFEDASLFLKRISHLKYYLNGELFYYLLKIRKNKIEKAFDSVYAHFGMNGKLAEELNYFGALQTKSIFVNFHGLDLLKTVYSRKYYHHLFKNAAGIICGSAYALSQLDDLGNTNKNTVIIPCGVNNKLFNHASTGSKKSSSKINIISVGRFIEFKGMIRFIDLAKLLLALDFRDFQIQLVGNGPEFDKIKNCVEENNLSEYILLTGSLPHLEVSGRIQQSDIFVYLGIVDSRGRAETQGVVILEAQFSALPVITVSVGGVHEYVKDGETGFIFEGKDLQSIAEKIIHLHENRDQLLELGINAHHFISDNYTQEVLLKKNFDYVSNLITQ